MLHELEVLEARRIAHLAEDARGIRDLLLEKVPDADLGELEPARGPHIPVGTIALNGLLAGKPEFVALREALASLPRDIREKLWVVTQIGRGDVAVLHWEKAKDTASLLTEDDILVNMLGEPDLHDYLRKGLYMLGVATLPGDAL
jgi:hypothetical protein